MDYQKQIKGPVIGPGGIGTAIWTGIRLCEVLRQVAPFDKPGLHVEFFGADKTEANGALYQMSLPLEVCMKPENDILLAYEMNEAPLTSDHGFPI